VRPRLACTGCERFVQAPLPSRPIERGRPGPGLLAHVLVSKYADHLPLYRQSQIFERDGLNLDRSTLADWVGKSPRCWSPWPMPSAGMCSRPRRSSRLGTGATRMSFH
jgi:transposase